MSIAQDVEQRWMKGKTMTNRDKVNQMDNDELAEWIVSNPRFGLSNRERIKIAVDIKSWLRKEADDDKPEQQVRTS